MNRSNDVLKKIVALRKTKGYSQEDMAEKLNLTESQYQRRESGKTALCVFYLIEIANVLDATPSRFFEKEEDECKQCSVYLRIIEDYRKDKKCLRDLVGGLQGG
jgi:transcriptional regulator with XRE-family HTH domain